MPSWVHAEEVVAAVVPGDLGGRMVVDVVLYGRQTGVWSHAFKIKVNA